MKIALTSKGKVIAFFALTTFVFGLTTAILGDFYDYKNLGGFFAAATSVSFGLFIISLGIPPDKDE